MPHVGEEGRRTHGKVGWTLFYEGNLSLYRDWLGCIAFVRNHKHLSDCNLYSAR